MSKFAFDRSGILTPQERVDAARKCLGILEDNVESLGQTERQFVERMMENLDRYGISERQLAWRRDISEKTL
jgi:hypothetical protein